MRFWVILGLLAFTNMFSTSAGAQEAKPTISAPEWAVPEIVVRAPAPRLWKLTRGTSTVYVLGVVEPLPKGQAWNSAQVAGIIGRADRVIISPYTTVGFFAGFQAFRQAHLPGRQRLDDELTPEMRGRLHAVLTRLGRNPENLDHCKAAWAALLLEHDLRDAGKLTDAEPVDTLRQIARQRRVRIVEAGHYDGAAMLKQYVNLPEQKGLELLSGAVDVVEHQLSAAPEIGHAWAIGDLHALHRVEGPSASLISLLKATEIGKALSSRSEDDIVDAINTALAGHGLSVTTASLDDFARRGGAIERLRAQGVVITEPLE